MKEPGTEKEADKAALIYRARAQAPKKPAQANF